MSVSVTLNIRIRPKEEASVVALKVSVATLETLCCDGVNIRIMLVDQLTDTHHCHRTVQCHRPCTFYITNFLTLTEDNLHTYVHDGNFHFRITASTKHAHH